MTVKDRDSIFNKTVLLERVIFTPGSSKYYQTENFVNKSIFVPEKTKVWYFFLLFFCPLNGKIPRWDLSYRPLHCTALNCTALSCTALNCAALHCTALHCTALHCNALHCTALNCTALHSSELNSNYYTYI